MNDTNTTQDFAKTLGTAIHGALIQGGAARQALLDARVALEAGDMEQVALIIRNHTADGTEKRLISVQEAIYESLPRGGGEPVAAGMADVSWSFYVPPTPKDQLEAAVDAAVASGQPLDSAGLEDDVNVAKAAIKFLALRVKQPIVAAVVTANVLLDEGEGMYDSISVTVSGEAEA